MCPESLTDSVSQPRPSTAAATPEVRRITGQNDRVNPLGHVVADNKVRVRGSEVASVSCSALSERGVRIGQLSLTSKRRCQDYGSTIEGVLSGNYKFLSGGNRLVLREARRCTVVRDDP